MLNECWGSCLQESVYSSGEGKLHNFKFGTVSAEKKQCNKNTQRGSGGGTSLNWLVKEDS